MSEALELFGEMLESGVQPNAIAINHMLAGCARDAYKFWRHANTIFEVTLGRGLVLVLSLVPGISFDLKASFLNMEDWAYQWFEIAWLEDQLRFSRELWYIGFF